MSREDVNIGNDVFSINRYYDTRGNINLDDCLKNGVLYGKRSYIHDNANRLRKVSVSEGNSNELIEKVMYYYDQNDNLSSAHYSNNTYHVYNYNCADMVTSMYLYEKGSNKCLESLEYTYNADAYISSKTELYNGDLSEIKYSYDGSSRLYEEDVVSNGQKYSLKYEYDNMGNRTSMEKTGANGEFKITYSYDKNNRLIGTNEINRGFSYQTDYTYDKNGNQISIEQYKKSDDNVFRLNIENISYYSKAGNDEKFEYNGLNQLTGYESLAGSYNGRKGYSAEYKYMPNGYRLSKDVNGITTKFLWDGDEIAAELNSVNVITKSYYRGIYLISDSSDNYYMSDAHGNIIEKYSSNSLTTWHSYNGFGSNDWFENSDMVNESNVWGYCGQYYDFEMGNYYMRARYYNPNTGRFITEDPMKDGYNWYAYCSNNPVNYVDINGLYQIYYNPNAKNVYETYIAKPLGFVRASIESVVAFVPFGTSAYANNIKEHGIVYSNTISPNNLKEYITNDSGQYVVNNIAKRVGSKFAKIPNIIGIAKSVYDVVQAIDTVSVDDTIFKMFEISGIYANSSNLEYLKGVMQKSCDYVSNDISYFFDASIIPGKTLFEINCEIMSETNPNKKEKLISKYVTNYNANFITEMGRSPTQYESFRFEDLISNRDRYNYMIDDFRKNVLA